MSVDHPHAPRDALVKFKATAEEKRQIEDAAEAAGLSMASWARMVLLKAARASP